jgi:hypothetical protein
LHYLFQPVWFFLRSQRVLHKTEIDCGSFYHPKFLRGRLDLCQSLIRARISGADSKEQTRLFTTRAPNFYTMPHCYDSCGDRLIPFPAIHAINHGNAHQKNPSVIFKTSHQQSLNPSNERQISDNKRKTNPERDVVVHSNKVPKNCHSVDDDVLTLRQKKVYGITISTETEFTMDDLNELMKL